MSNIFGGRGRKTGGADDADKNQGGAEMADTETGATADTTAREEPQRNAAKPPAAGSGSSKPPRGQPRLWQELGVNSAAGSEDGAERQLVIGSGVEVRGNISNCDEVIVEGSAEVEISATRLSVRPGGRVSGSAHVTEAVVDGAFDGELTVDGPLAVTEAGCITGTVCYGSLEVGLGGRIIGEIQHGPRQTATETGKPTEAAAAGA